MARLNLMQTVQPGEVGAADGNLKYEERPQWMKNWEKTGLLEFEDKNGDGRIQYYDDTNPEFVAKAESYGWAGNEMVKVDKDIMVLANPEIAKFQLGHCASRCRWSRCGSFYSRWTPAGYFFCCFP